MPTGFDYFCFIQITCVAVGDVMNNGKVSVLICTHVHKVRTKVTIECVMFW